MRTLANHLFLSFAHLGGFGLLALGALDSSFLFMPLGNDLLVIAMTARRHALMPYYASMAALGSLLGCASLDVLGRKGGEKGLGRHLTRKRLDYVISRVKKNATWALAFASLMPPPFPFSPFVLAASAANYPRKKLLAVIGVSRLVRFSIEGMLAIVVGQQVLRLTASRALEYGIVALVILSIAGSVFSVYHWTRTQQRRSTAGTLRDVKTL